MARCLACDLALHDTTHEGRTLRACHGCGGLFISHSTLVDVAADAQQPRSEQERTDALAGATGRQMDARNDVEVRRCPVCAKPMRRYVYAYSSGVVVDGCDAHGIWLDAGELERIEAWTEATSAAAPASDVVTAQTAAPADPRPRGRSDAEVDVLARTVDALAPATGLAPAAGALVAGGRFLDALNASRATKANAGEAILFARVRAEADAAPDPADPGVTVVEAAQLVVASPDEVWPRLARVERLVEWMTGVERATTVSGLGSSRVQQLEYAHEHVVVQRVSALQPGQRIAWIDAEETLRGMTSPLWHDGCWTELLLARDPVGCLVTWRVTFRAADADQQARVDERLAAQHAWMAGSLDTLARSSAAQAA